MTISMYSASVPVFKQLLNALSDVLKKAEAQTIKDNIAPEKLLQARLFPDMFDLVRQVQVATDFAKGVTARLAGLDVPAFEDNEACFSDVQARIAKTIHFIEGVEPAKIDGSEAREIITRPGTPKKKKFTGQQYLLNYGLPQFFFHVTTTYGILRNNGIEIGKRDFMGEF